MSARKDGGPAFPVAYDFERDVAEADGGMTLRDYFAAAALSGFCAAQAHPRAGGYEPDPQEVSAAAYRAAAAMLAERDR